MNTYRPDPKWYSEQIKVIEDYKNVKIIFLVNDKIGLDITNKLGYSSILCSKNCFIDERIFFIKDISKKYDALMISQLMNFKNIEFSKKIKNLYIATYADRNKPHLYDFRPEVKHAKTNDKLLSCGEMNILINESSVGLSLSTSEGQNRATVEYSLCGLPIISPLSTGGRDLFYNKYTKIVELDSSVIENEMKNILNEYDSVDRNYIRKNTLDIITEHRQRFKDLIGIEDTNNLHFLDMSEFIILNNLKEKLCSV